MKSYLINTPRLVKLFFRNWVWDFSKKEKAIYLTFDDGPTHEITEWTLNQLRQYNAKATFFCIGKNVQKNPEIFQKIIEHGHSIGNHTNNHLNGYETELATYLTNIELAEQQFNTLNLKIQNSKLFRPPYGKLRFAQSKKIRGKGYKIVMWDVLSADFDTTITPEKCLENVIGYTENGSIIVFHDSVKASENLYFVLPKILEYYSEKGFVFKKIR
ncbi:MAG: polysaccharide deacetylase family protein [Lutibacter sp.]|uniref:polysaccharide deacetylase family protein n=1 Tax=Lutibacter sp. TaxID=1925666 RepID=UPI00385DDA70